MWTAQQARRKNVTAVGAAEQGQVTCSEELTGVYTDGDRRWLPLYTPGGYCWRPAAGDRVLVIKAGENGESACVIGREQKQDELSEGEVCLYSAKGAKNTLTNDKRVALEGSVTINGMGLESLIRKVVASMLGG